MILNFGYGNVQTYTKPKKIKCAFKDCRRKINTFSTIECVCKHKFCDEHRLTFNHDCRRSTAIKQKAKETIAKQNPVIKKDVWNLKF